MDRCRTTVNVIGDSVVAGIVESKIYGARAFQGQQPTTDALGGEVKGAGGDLVRSPSPKWLS